MMAIEPIHDRDGIRIYNGDCLEVLRRFDENSIDSIVTDPPYGIAFMGKKWDYDVPGVELWAECLRVLKPGGHLLSFAGTRTQHRMAVRIEDAGFEIRDMIAWVYGSGFPKSLDIGKAIDRAAGAEREVVGQVRRWGANASGGRGNQNANSYQPSIEGAEKFDPITAPATEAAKQWDGWGSALKPALEPITMARKPLIGTIAGNVLKHGVGGINVDGCRIGTEEITTQAKGQNQSIAGLAGPDASGSHKWNGCSESRHQGRFPANLIHDGSDEVVGLFSETGASSSAPRNNGEFKSVAKGRELPHVTVGHDNGGSAARFFYCAKSDASERRGSTHPTVKPIALMRYLVRLVTPIGATVLDPFMGSGTTLEAAMLEHCHAIGIDRESDYCKDAIARLEQPILF